MVGILFKIYLILLMVALSTEQMWPMNRPFGYPQYPSYGSSRSMPMMMDDDYMEPQPMPMSMAPGNSYYSPMSSYRRPFGYGGTPFGGQNAQDVAMASLINYVYDKDNFQAQGCGWDGGRNRCTDVLNQCKGICRDFANDVITHDCRCVPFGYAALLGWTTKK